MIRNSVVPETFAVNEADFHIAVVAGLNRARKTVGERALSYVMDLSRKGLSNVFGGASTSAKRLWDALAADASALDDVAALYGRRIIPADALSSAEAGTVPIALLLAKVAEAEHPSSAGGEAKTHKELLAMERDLRAVHRLTGAWLDEISSIRAPRAVG